MWSDGMITEDVFASAESVGIEQMKKIGPSQWVARLRRHCLCSESHLRVQAAALLAVLIWHQEVVLVDTNSLICWLVVLLGDLPVSLSVS